MLTCRICLHTYKQLQYASTRVTICGRCVNSLNENPEVAQHAEKRLADLLASGMVRNAFRDVESPELWKRKKAQWVLDHFDLEHSRALPGWLNCLLADPKNSTRDFKLLRAHRQGLLHYDRPEGWGYPNNWCAVAARIRKLDGYSCVKCSATDTVLDVHHIVYASHFGTHQQSNLITLCRACHEEEHERTMDFGEVEQPVPPSAAA